MYIYIYIYMYMGLTNRRYTICLSVRTCRAASTTISLSVLHLNCLNWLSGALVLH